MWQQEEATYWKARDKKRRSTGIVVGMLALVAVVAVGGAWWALGGSTDDDGSGNPADSRDAVERQVITALPMDEQQRCTRDCAAHAVGCYGICKSFHNQLPRPALAESCTTGCKDVSRYSCGFACGSRNPTARSKHPEMGVEGVGVDCKKSPAREELSRVCQNVCSKFKAAVPRPTMMKACLHGCKKAIPEHCTYGYAEYQRMVAELQAIEDRRHEEL